MFNLQYNTQHQLNEETKKHLFLRAVNDGSIEALDLMVGGDITQKTWTDIHNIYLNYSRATMKKGRGLRDLPYKSNDNSQVFNMELSNFLLDFKKDIINDVATQQDTIQAKMKKDKADAMLTEYYPHYREKKRHYRCKSIVSVET